MTLHLWDQYPPATPYEREIKACMDASRARAERWAERAAGRGVHAGERRQEGGVGGGQVGAACR